MGDTESVLDPLEVMLGSAEPEKLAVTLGEREVDVDADSLIDTDGDVELVGVAVRHRDVLIVRDGDVVSVPAVVRDGVRVTVLEPLVVTLVDAEPEKLAVTEGLREIDGERELQVLALLVPHKDGDAVLE